MIPGSNKEHPTFIRSFGYAWEGFVTAVRTERNIKVMLAMGAAALIVGFLLQLDVTEWCIILICCGLVIHAELANTAIEAVVDLATDELTRSPSAPRTSPQRACTCSRSCLRWWDFWSTRTRLACCRRARFIFWARTSVSRH